MGRPRKPIEALKLRGTARKDRGHFDQFSVAPGPLGPPPKGLKRAGKEEWIRVTEHPEYSKVLAPIHFSLLFEYCHLIDKSDDAIRGKGQMMVSERILLNSLRMQLGLTPASQSKVRLPQKEKAKTNWSDVDPQTTRGEQSDTPVM